MRTWTDDNWAGFVFDSWSEYVSHVDQNRTMSQEGGSHDMSFACVDSFDAGIKLAREGLPADGIKALALADDRLAKLDRELVDTRFTPVMDYTGSYVDMERFLTGDPENMVSFQLENYDYQTPVVTLVITTGVLGNVSSDDIYERGVQIMTLLDAIERTGMTTEIWSDSTTTNRSDSLYGRISVKIKSAGAPYDASTFMFCMTHSAMHRLLNFNTKNNWPKRWARALGKEHGYGSTVMDRHLHRPEDYPEGAIFIPALRAGRPLDIMPILRELGLVTEESE